MYANILLSSSESLGERLKSAMLPEKVHFIGNLNVGPSMFTAFIVSGLIILFCLIVRFFIIPHFKIVPGKFQLFLETLVGGFSKMANEGVAKYKDFIGSYIFTASTYICLGTLIEMLGLRPVLADINSCIALALFTYVQIIIYSLKNRGVIGGTLHSIKEFTVPISFSLRLFGSIVSGFLIMELVYHFLALSFVLPAALSVIFTLFHAFIQAYVFAMLSSIFLGESIECGEKRLATLDKRQKRREAKKAQKHKSRRQLC